MFKSEIRFKVDNQYFDGYPVRNGGEWEVCERVDYACESEVHRKESR